jgi:uncharacterized protein
MTQVDVTHIPEEGLRVSISEDAEDLDLSAPGTRFRERVSGELHLAKAGEAICATGRLTVPVTFECMRCLRPFHATLDIPVAAQFLPGPPPAAPGEHQMPEDEAEDYYYADNVVVLDDLVRQEVFLAIPFSPQCRPECRGLCGQCGQDLNVETCACAPPPDPRLAGLREYLRKK